MKHDLVLLGIDGVGKSTIAVALRDRLIEMGHDTVITSWSSASKRHPNDFERGCMGDVLYTAFRCMYAQARTADGTAQGLFPPSASEFFQHESLHGQFLDLAITDNEAWGLLAGALTEIAGNFMHRYMDVMPKLQAGKIVIQETFGLKHLVKDLHLSRTVAEKNGNDVFLPLISQLEELGETLYSNVLAPQIGIVVDGDPDAAIERRLAQDGRAGWTEDMQLAGDPGRESFRHMQHYTRRIFLDYADRHNWPVLTITNEGKEANVARGVDFIIEALSGTSPPKLAVRQAAE